MDLKSMIKIVGIDPSLSCTGVCVMDIFGNVENLYSVKCHSKTPVYERQEKMVLSLLPEITHNNIVVMEDFGISARFSNSGRYVERIELCGMIKFHVYTRSGLGLVSVSPKLLKSFVSGNAKADKVDMIDAVRRVWNQNPANDDEADAFGLAKLVQAYVSNDYMHKKSTAKLASYGDNGKSLARLNFWVGKK